MKCKEPGCNGEINENITVHLRVGCSVTAVQPAHPCSLCGRLYWDDGSLVYNRPGYRVFLEGSHIIHRDDDNQLVACDFSKV